MKRLLFLAVISIILSTGLPSYAQSLKMVTLKDGSTLKGKVVRLQDQIYTIKTSALGMVDIHESNIVSITPLSKTSSQASSTDQTHPYELRQTSNPSQLKTQVQQIQQQFLSDPSVMAEVENIMQNEEVMEILGDQDFLNDVMSYDENRLKSNDKTQQLMQNPEMKSLMDKIKIRLEAQEEIRH